jgi:hypothetical protein
MRTVEPGTPHAGAHSLDDQVTLKFSDRSDDDHDGSAQRAGRIDIFTEADELDVEPVQLVEHFEEVPGGACDPIARPDQDNLEPTAAGIRHHLIETWPACLHSRYSVRVFLDDLVATLSSHLTQVVDLRLRVLIDGTDPHIYDGAFHLRRPFGCLAA